MRRKWVKRITTTTTTTTKIEQEPHADTNKQNVGPKKNLESKWKKKKKHNNF